MRNRRSSSEKRFVPDIFSPETEGRYGRSYVLLLFLNESDRFSGYFLNPHIPAEKASVFHDYLDFENKLRQLTEQAEQADEHDDTVACYSGWLPGNCKKPVSFAVHMAVTGSGEWQGDIFDPRTRKEVCFYKKEQLEELLAAGKSV